MTIFLSILGMVLIFGAMGIFIYKSSKNSPKFSIPPIIPKESTPPQTPIPVPPRKPKELPEDKQNTQL